MERERERERENVQFNRPQERRAERSNVRMFSVTRLVALMTSILSTRIASGTSRNTSSSLVHDQTDQTCWPTDGLMSQMAPV